MTSAKPLHRPMNTPPVDACRVCNPDYFAGCASHLKPHLESTKYKSLAVEWHIPFQPGIRHDLGVDRVALRAALIDNPGEDDDLVLLGLHGAVKGGHFPDRH